MTSMYNQLLTYLLDAALAPIISRLEKVMNAKFEEVLKRIDDATNAIAAKLDAYADQIANGLTSGQAAELVGMLQADADRLEAIGKPDQPATPENPMVPPTPNPGDQVPPADNA